MKKYVLLPWYESVSHGDLDTSHVADPLAKFFGLSFRLERMSALWCRRTLRALPHRTPHALSAPRARRRLRRWRRRRRRGGAQSHDNQTKDEASASTTTRGSGRRGGRDGRGKGKGFANAVMDLTDSDAVSYAGTASAQGNEVNDDVDISSYIDFVLDSACYPTYIRSGGTLMTHDPSGYATVTDGRRVPVHDAVNVRVATESGHQFTLHRICRADFARNLLSVTQILETCAQLLFCPASVLFL